MYLNFFKYMKKFNSIKGGVFKMADTDTQDRRRRRGRRRRRFDDITIILIVIIIIAVGFAW